MAIFSLVFSSIRLFDIILDDQNLNDDNDRIPDVDEENDDNDDDDDDDDSDEEL